MRYVIVGAGPAGVIAAETLRREDPAGDIVVVGDEHPVPYSRMAIPYYLAGEIPEEGMHLRKDAGHFDALRIRRVHDAVASVDTRGRTALLKQGGSIPYDRLLVATGSVPVRPPITGLEGPGVFHCWTLRDAKEIVKLAQPDSRVVLLGAGFIGSIVLDALQKRRVKLTVVEVEDRMVPRMTNAAAGKLILKWCLHKGVDVRVSTRVLSAAKDPDGRTCVALSTGDNIEADLVIVATGVRPRTDFLSGSGIVVGPAGGVAVNEYLRSSIPEVYAAGDAAEGLDFSTGQRALHPIQPTATEQGRTAALNMAGKSAPYQGSLNMNVLATIGLLTHSFGLWGGVRGGEHAEQMDAEGFRYLQIQFHADRIVGAIAIGEISNVGLLRGLIQSKLRLGPWKTVLQNDPGRFAEAYLGLTKMVRTPVRLAG